MAATSLYFAGIEIPEYMQARPLFGPQAQPREYVVTARDRCDETVDRIRGIRKSNYKYIRNFYPKRPLFTALYIQRQKSRLCNHCGISMLRVNSTRYNH